MISIGIECVGAVPRMMKRELNAIKKTCFELIGVYWHRHFRPKHFTHAGAREYGYAARKGERGNMGSTKLFQRTYTGRKLKRFGHTLPLVYTGMSRQLSRIRRIRATPKRVRVAIKAPAFNRHVRNSQVNMREEMETVSRGEGRTLSRVYQHRMMERLDRMRRRERIRVA